MGRAIRPCLESVSRRRGDDVRLRSYGSQLSRLGCVPARRHLGRGAGIPARRLGTRIVGTSYYAARRRRSTPSAGGAAVMIFEEGPHLVIAAHPDDEVLGAGGWMARFPGTQVAI